MHKSEDIKELAAAGRRDFIKKAAYVAPAILTLAVAPEYAKAGSVKKLKKAEGGEKKSRRPRERD